MAYKRDWSKECEINNLSSGQSKIIKVQGDKILVSRNKNLNKYGTPVYRASFLGKDNATYGKSVRGCGTGGFILSELFKKNRK